MKSIIRTAIIFTLVVPLIGFAFDAVLLPVADSYVRNGTFANSNYGSDTPMVVFTNNSAGGLREAFLKFNLANVGLAKEATLYVYAHLNGDTIAGKIWAVGVSDTNWTENGITFNNKPAFGANIDSKTIGVVTPTLFSFDITPYINSEQLAGKTFTTVAFRKHNENGSAGINIRSRESDGWEPLLLITTNIPPTVSITSPTNGFTTSFPGNFTFSWSSSDSDGTVTNTALFVNGAKIGSGQPTNNFSFNWYSSAGTYSNVVVATDNTGGTTVSAPVVLTLY